MFRIPFPLGRETIKPPFKINAFYMPSEFPDFSFFQFFFQIRFQLNFEIPQEPHLRTYVGPQK